MVIFNYNTRLNWTFLSLGLKTLKSFSQQSKNTLFVSHILSHIWSRSIPSQPVNLNQTERGGTFSTPGGYEAADLSVTFLPERMLLMNGANVGQESAQTGKTVAVETPPLCWGEAWKGAENDEGGVRKQTKLTEECHAGIKGPLWCKNTSAVFSNYNVSVTELHTNEKVHPLLLLGAPHFRKVAVFPSPLEMRKI